MDFNIALILGQDGITSGAIYALLALCIILVFTVTRILLIPLGEFTVYGALTLASIQAGTPSSIVWLVVAFLVVNTLLDVYAALRHKVAFRWKNHAGLAVYCAVLAGCMYGLPLAELPTFVQVLLTLAVITPLGPMMYRTFFEPLASAKSLVLLIVSIAAHVVLVGVGLIIFGPNGAQTRPFSEATFNFGSLSVNSQTLCILAAFVLLIIALWYFFGKTLYGKALHATAVNRVGAQLMGISPIFAGKVTFALASFIGCLSGILIAPITTLYYDSGFIISLKGFVGAIIGGLTSFPLAAAGSIIVGIIESFSMFWASDYKEIIVFTLIIPFLIWKSLTSLGGGRRMKAKYLFLGFALIMAVSPFILPDYQVTLLNYIGLNALVVLGLVLLTGVGGMTSFGQAALVGIGAYTTAYLTATEQLPQWLGWAGGSPWIALILGIGITIISAMIVGGMTLKLSGHYLPLGTIAWGLSLYYFFSTLASLGGHSGISNIPSVSVFGYTLDNSNKMFYLIWLILCIAILLTRNLLNSREGRAIRALNGGQVMAESMGVNTFRSKLVIFTIASIYASVSGWLYAHNQAFINPTPFGLQAGIDYLFMGLLGGVSSIWGAILGAGMFTMARQWLQDFLPIIFGSEGHYETIVFGLLIVVLMQKAPAGLWPILVKWIPQRFRPEQAAHLEMTPPTRQLPAQQLPVHGTLILEARNVTKKFGGLVANNNMNLNIHAGEILALIGPNGAGKSTMFNQLSGVDVPTSGEVVFLGEKINGRSSRDIAKKGLSRTFQHVKILPDMTVLENVAIGAHLRGEKGVMASMLHLDREEENNLLNEARLQLERVGLGDDLYTEAGSLALGQQRILEIARALCARPSLLLLDEPAAGLRFKEKQALADLLTRLRAEGMAILLVEHDMDFVMNLVDRVVVMEFGQKIAEGLPEEVQKNEAVLEAYLGGAA